MMKFWFDIGERINGGCEIYGSGDRGACCGVAMEMEMVACVGAYLRLPMLAHHRSTSVGTDGASLPIGLASAVRIVWKCFCKFLNELYWLIHNI